MWHWMPVTPFGRHLRNFPKWQSPNCPKRRLLDCCKSKCAKSRHKRLTRGQLGILDAALAVWNLQKVLLKKTNASTRQVFIDVVAHAPIPKDFLDYAPTNHAEFDMFGMFWNKLSHDFGLQVTSLLEENNTHQNVALLYPAIRAASLHMLGSLHDTMQAGTTANTTWDGDTSSSGGTSSSAVGILGGSAVLAHDLTWK